MSRHRECESGIHARGVILHWRFQELPTSLKATISSNFRAISFRPIPRIAPLKKNVFPAGQLRVKPGPHLQQAADAPLQPDLSAGGLSDRLMTFSRVLFPAPLRPMTPTHWPRLTSKETSLRAQNSSLTGAAGAE